MKLENALNLNEETVKKCLAYFSKIYGSPTDIRQAENRSAAAEHEDGVQDGDDYYEGSDRKTFFRDLVAAIGQIKQPNIKTKFSEYVRAYAKNAPEDGHKCDVNGVVKMQRKVNEANYAAQNSTKHFDAKLGYYVDKEQEKVK